MHPALRLEAALNRAATARARRRGHRPDVLAYTSYAAPTWARVLARVVLLPPDAPAGAEPARGRVWRRFLSLEQAGVEVSVEVGGARVTATSDHSGYLDLVVPAALVPGWTTATLRVEGRPPATARVRVVDPEEPFGLLSDIDDTVIVTMLPRPLLAAWNSFVVHGHARKPVPGMAALYRALLAGHPGAPVVYLSTGAWNAADTLTGFLARHGYPAGPLLLTDWGPTRSGLFRSGQGHKRAALRRLAEDFPHVRWLLVGDDGQHDPALYAEFAATHPEQVRGVAIRQLTPAQAVLAHGTATSRAASPARTLAPVLASAVPGDGVPSVVGADGDALAARLREAGLLEA